MGPRLRSIAGGCEDDHAPHVRGCFLCTAPELTDRDTAEDIYSIGFVQGVMSLFEPDNIDTMCEPHRARVMTMLRGFGVTRSGTSGAGLKNVPIWSRR